MVNMDNFLMLFLKILGGKIKEDTLNKNAREVAAESSKPPEEDNRVVMIKKVSSS